MIHKTYQRAFFSLLAGLFISYLTSGLATWVGFLAVGSIVYCLIRRRAVHAFG